MENDKFVARFTVPFLFVTAVCALSFQASAQTSYAAESQAKGEAERATTPASHALVLEEVIVTATKRDENLQDVGISVTAFSRKQIVRLGFTTATDIMMQAPAVSYYSPTPSLTVVNIRGVSQNDFADHLEPPVAIYVDEGYLGSPGAIAVPIFDLQRVEVLRGPQGTLFGRNATGGLIHYISVEPGDTFEGYVQASFGNFSTFRTEGAINIPLADGIRSRLSFSTNYSDGPFTNLIGKQPGNTNNFAVRAQLAFDLGDQTELLVRAKGYTNHNERGVAYSYGVSVIGPDGLGVLLAPDQIGAWPNIITDVGLVPGACPGCNIVGYQEPDDGLYTSSISHPGAFKRDIWGIQARLKHGFGDTTLTAISDYYHMKKTIDTDVDTNPFQFWIYNTRQKYDQFSQEVRLDGESGPLSWVAGLYYLHMNGHYGARVDLDLSPYFGIPACLGEQCPPGGNFPGALWNDFSLKVDSGAVFGQGEYEISPRVTAILGGRYTYDKKKFDYLYTNFVTVPTPGGPLQIPGPYIVYNPSTDPDASRSFDDVSLKAQIDWRPVEDTLLYLSYTRAHKGGNWSAPVFPPINPGDFAHKPEVLTAYETGIKTRFWDNRATFNASVYYYDYKDYQAFSLLNATQIITNNPARIYGAEAELRISPVEGLEFSIAAATVDGKAKNISLPSGRVTSREMPNTPDLHLNGIVRYGWSMFGGTMTAQAVGTYKSDYYLTLLNEPVNKETEWATLDLRLSWFTPDEALEISAYAGNVTNTHYRIYALDVSILSVAQSAYANPQTYGVSVRYSF